FIFMGLVVVTDHPSKPGQFSLSNAVRVNMKLLSLTTFFVCFAVIAGFAQKQDDPEMTYSETPSSLHPGEQRKESKTRTSKSSKKKVVQKTGRDLEKEYYDRVLAVAKAREKAARIMEK